MNRGTALRHNTGEDFLPPVGSGLAPKSGTDHEQEQEVRAVGHQYRLWKDACLTPVGTGRHLGVTFLENE